MVNFLVKLWWRDSFELKESAHLLTTVSVVLCCCQSFWQNNEEKCGRR